jgi:hypothetical protein
MDRLQQIAAALMIAGLGGIAAARQTATPQNPPATGPAITAVSPSKPTPKAKPSAVKTTTTARPATERIPLESASPTPPSAAAKQQEAQQHAADERLLQQQQAQSAAAAQVTNQIVQTAQKQQDKVQNEVRIQDAPGPTETGVVPAAGPPTVPAADKSQDIQDAPGPAQTLAPALAAQPATPSATPVTPPAR